MGEQFTMWTDPWNTNLKQFQSALEEQKIPFDSYNVEGDESTCYIDGVVYCFETSDQLDVAQEIYDNL